MKKVRRVVSKWITRLFPRPLPRFAFRLGLFLMVVGAVMFMTGCAGLPQWLSTADQFLPVAVESIGAILTALAVLSGNPELAAAVALISKIASEIEAGVKDLEAMVEEYKAAPTGTLLQSIEAGAQAVIDNITKLLGDFGLPANLAAPFVSLAQLLLTQFEAWVGFIPTLKLAYADHDIEGVKAAVANMKSIPLTPDQFKQVFNNIVISNPDLHMAPLE